MIHIVIALDWESTQTCYVRRYTDEVRAEAINVGGLVFAIFGMGTQLRMEKRMETLPDKTGIIESEGMALVYATQNPIIMVAVVERQDNIEIARKKMRALVKQFNEKYGSELEKWRESALGPNMFSSFDPILDEELEKGLITTPHIPELKGRLNHIVVDLGIMTDKQFQIAKACDGKQTVYDIAQSFEMSIDEVEDILTMLESKKILRFKK